MGQKKYLFTLITLLFTFSLGLSGSASESPVYYLNPTLESGLSGEVQNCSVLSVENGSISPYPSCAITCDVGYQLSGNSCVKTTSGGGGGGGGGGYIPPIPPVVPDPVTEPGETPTTESGETPTDGGEQTLPTSTGSSVEVNKVMAEERSLVTRVNTQLRDRLLGRILLQVENKGQAWYLEPLTRAKYFMGRPADAFAMMRHFGLGISEANFTNFEVNGVPQRLAGRILLRVEANGEAYYINPTDLKMHYLGRPADAFKIMRELALGISNDNIRQILVGDIIKD